jgi:hypothetical protein
VLELRVFGELAMTPPAMCFGEGCRWQGSGKLVCVRSV